MDQEEKFKMKRPLLGILNSGSRQAGQEEKGMTAGFVQ
jgi:hypothetical protein